MELKCKMAARKKRTRSRVNYSQLNSVSSAVLYDTVPKNTARFYAAERIIERRQKPQVNNCFFVFKIAK